jgi:hypothetical protein
MNIHVLDRAVGWTSRINYRARVTVTQLTRARAALAALAPYALLAGNAKSLPLCRYETAARVHGELREAIARRERGEGAR